MWLLWRTEVVVWEGDGLLEPNHEGLVEALRIQANEEEGVRLARGRLPDGFERGAIDQCRALRLDRLILFLVSHAEGEEARGVDPTRRAHQSELLNR